jgi:hypothetical protein
MAPMADSRAQGKLIPEKKPEVKHLVSDSFYECCYTTVDPATAPPQNAVERMKTLLHDALLYEADVISLTFLYLHPPISVPQRQL